MSRRQWLLISAGILLAGGIGYAIHLDPWKDSTLFQRLLTLVQDNPKMPIDLLANDESVLLSADREADALLKDDFTYESVGATSSVVLCGNWVFPSGKPARFVRDGSILRGDNYVYVVEIYVNGACGLDKADGRIGPVPFL